MSDRFDRLSDFLDAKAPKLGVSGVDMVIYQDHKEIYRHAAGYQDLEYRTSMDPNALYNIYSASKVITCAAALQLLERGKLLLQDPVAAYLPEFEYMQVKSGTYCITPARRAIRVIDLLTMTAGLSYELDTPAMRNLREATGGVFTTRDFVRALAKEPLLFEPGESWNYSYSHDVLGALIEVVSGMRFGAYLKENIFDPLGMVDTGFSIPEEKRARLAPQYQHDRTAGTTVRIASDCQGAAGKGHESGGGGLISTVADYIKFADAMACGGEGQNGARILSARTIDLMRRNRLTGSCMDSFQKMACNPGIGYGLGVGTITDSAASCSLLPEGSFYWGGIGGVQNLFDPKNRLSFFVAQHTMNSPKELLSPYIWNILYAD